MGGLFITMEGVEGSGKSTQMHRLEVLLRGLGIPLRVSKEPGGTALGQELRGLLLAPHGSGERWCPDAELLLFYADRAQHLDRVVRPALAEGQVVLVDRFEDSSRAYQGAQGVAEEALEGLRRLVLKGLAPDLTLLLDMPPERSLARVQARNAAQAGFRETRFDAECLAFHQRVRARFLDLASREPGRVKRVDADRDVDAVAEDLWALVCPVLRAAGHRVA